MKKTIVTILLTATLFGVMLNVSEKKSAPISVTTESAMVLDIYNAISAKGSIEAARESWVASPVGGEIAQLYVSQGDRVKSGQRLARIVSTAISPPDAQAVLGLLQSGALQNQEDLAAVFQPSLLEEDSYLYSPHDGVIMTQTKNTGDSVLASVPFLKLSDTSTLRARFEIPEAYAQKIKPSMSTEITGTAFEGETFYGKITEILPFAKTSFDITGQTKPTYIEAYSSISNKNESLKSGFTTSVKVITDTVKAAVIVPFESVFQEGELEFVFVLSPSGQAILQQVVTGYEMEKGIEIKQGIQGGQRVIVNPPPDLRHGQRVVST